MPAPHPRMHGITHVLGGPDPVPGLLPAAHAGNWPLLVTSLPDLRGYWRLGEGATPYLDTSGYIGGGGTAADMQINTGHVGAPPVSEDVTPGLLPPPHDDGAVAFNEQGDELNTIPLSPHLELADSSTAGHFNFGAGNPAMSAVAIIRPALSSSSFWGGVVADAAAAAGGGLYGLDGWALDVRFPTGEVRFLRGSSVSSQVAATSGPILTAGSRYVVAATFDGSILRLYVNGELAASAADATSLSGYHSLKIGGHRDGLSSSYPNIWRPFLGVIDEVAVYGGALTDLDVAALFQAMLGGAGGEGSLLVIGDDGTPAWLPPPADGGDVLGSGPDGTPAWVAPPAPEVTVNGSSEPAAETPRPSPTPPPPPDPDPAGVLMIDQPFSYGGTTFTVAPRTWTTIPFTTQLMERMSDKTGVSAWADIPVGDPDAGGWLHPDFPHGIVVAHDMPFLAEAMGQICLRIDNPIVQGATSHRALRILETTHQKTLLQVDSEQADGAGAEGGMTDVFRGPGIVVFASGDTGSTGTHPDIFFAPNYGLAFYPSGYDWLPYIAGVQSLKKGMRLVAQCWHDATVPLTFSCAPGTTYKPHFVLNADADPAWGPPWSTWL